MTEASNPGLEYQTYVLGVLGADDPETVQSQTPAAMRQVLADAGDQVATRPEPGEFSVLELLGHLLDAEMVSFTRYRWILAQDQPSLPGYEQDDWVRVSGYNQTDPAALLELWAAARRANLELWRRTSVEGRARVGMHAERGPESYELTFRLIAGHDRIHLDQARRTIEAVRRAGAS